MGSIDIDNLLEELELDNSPANTPALAQGKGALAPVSKLSWDDSSPETSPACKAGRGASGKSSAGGDSLDDLLGDLDCVDDTSSCVSQAGGSGLSDREDQHVSGAQSGGSTRKCLPVYLAGSRDEHGIGPGRGCSNLRCTKCDFEVLRVADREWKDDVEYLFFRNFYPNLEKLQSKLVKAPGGSCYACQCTWRSVKQMSLLDKSPEMRWVCGGHRVPE